MKFSPGICRLIPNALVAAWLLICALPCGVVAQPDSHFSPDSESIRSLIEGLTDTDFHVRQHCEEQLIRIGADALPSLESVRHAGDSELRLRVVRIIGIVRDDYLGLQMTRFRNGEMDLPGWQSFLVLQGDSASDRREFAEIYQSHARLLVQHDASDPDPLAFLQELVVAFDESREFQTRLDPRMAVVISMQIHKVFSQNPDTAHVPVDFQNLRLAAIYKQRPFQQMVAGGRFGQLHRKALAQWIVWNDSQLGTMASRLSIARTYAVPEAVDLAAGCLQQGDNAPITSESRCDAIQILADLGDESHIDVLSRHLDDQLLVTRGQRRNADNRLQVYTTFVSDVALAAMIHLSPSTYTDFGYDHLGVHPADQPLPFHLSGFNSDQRRQAAKTKWTELYPQR
ncbi:MAG: hypothetical protein ACR2NP_17570 [Pirellulaceae bacterium]